MIGTGTGRVGGLTGAGKVGALSVSFRTTFVAPQEFTTLRNVGDAWPAAILPNLARAHLADTAQTSSLRRYDDETQSCKDNGATNFARALHGRALFRLA